MAFENYQDMRNGDIIECYDVEELRRTLEDATRRALDSCSRIPMGCAGAARAPASHRSRRFDRAAPRSVGPAELRPFPFGRLGGATSHSRLFAQMSRSDPRHPGPSHRLERVGELIRHAIADILQRGEVVDPVLDRQAVTISSVKMSPDLKLATVVVMPGGKNAHATIEALGQHKKALRALVARRVNLKFAPDLRFVLDHSFSAHADIDA